MNISQLSQIQQAGAQGLEYGWVQQVDGVNLLIRQENGSTLIAHKAFGCSFKVEQDDYVMFVRTPHVGAFVLTILTRRGKQDATLAVNGQLSLQAGEEVQMHAPSIELASGQTQLTNEKLAINSNRIHAVSEHTHFQTRNLESVADRVIQRVKDSFKVIERIEQVSARDIIQNIKNAFIQKSQQVDISAKSDVKINGDRIHMG